MCQRCWACQSAMPYIFPTGPVLRITTERSICAQVCSVARAKSASMAGMPAGRLQDAPCTNIRSEASTPSPRPVFSNDSSLSGYASAATLAGARCERSKGWAPTQPIKMPGSGLLTRHAQGEGIGGARRLSGGGFFLRLLLPFSLSALICLSAVASRSSGAQEQQDLDPPSYHAMGGSLKRSHRQAWRNCSAPMRTCTPLRCAGASSGRMSSLRIRHPRCRWWHLAARAL